MIVESCLSNNYRDPTSFVTKVRDEGACVREMAVSLGYQNLWTVPAGGASFTGWHRNFLRLLKQHWFKTVEYKSVLLLWAGNDLGRCEPDALAEAIDELQLFCVEWNRTSSRHTNVQLNPTNFHENECCLNPEIDFRAQHWAKVLWNLRLDPVSSALHENVF